MKYFKELSENPKIKSYFDSLIGLPINEVCKKLGYWWLCRSSHISFEHGSYVFERAAGGRIELRTENNIVVSENHNGMAMLFAKRDINNENA